MNKTPFITYRHVLIIYIKKDPTTLDNNQTLDEEGKYMQLSYRDPLRVLLNDSWHESCLIYSANNIYIVFLYKEESLEACII